ncbi:MAG: hypothetical protein KC777_02550 [Cyanobacteria bacterium HKST-UBA02]|nr:hypothetical protein [Cyanobacteria bacterium HKST-UBA02]
MPQKLSASSVNERRSRERKVRAKLQKLLREGQGFLGGTPMERWKKCGRESCKCTMGEKHFGVYLVRRVKGNLRQAYIPADWNDDVHQWVTNYRLMRELLDELSDIWWENVREKEL